MPKSALSRILIVTRNLPPLIGGMERLNWHMAEQLAKHAEVRVMGPSGATAHAPRGVTIEEAPLEPLLRFLLVVHKRALHQARTWQPNWIVAGSGLTAPVAWLAGKACRAKTAVYLHGLDIAVRNPAYQTFWLPTIRRMDRVIANSSATRRLAIDAGVKPRHIGIVHPGVELPTTGRQPASVSRFRADHQLGARAVLLSLGRLSERKGLREFVTMVLPQIVASRPDVILLIVGGAPRQALHAKEQSVESIHEAAKASGVEENIRVLGVVTDQERLALYQASDVHVFPVLNIPNNPEGFGMVAIEAAAHGLPTVAYSTGGVVDAIAEGRSGILVQPGDASAFAKAVLRLLNHPLQPASLRNHAERFTWEKFGERLVWILQNDQATSRRDI